ncbi:glycoside hydrolase family 35 protein [Schleiferilactobacillus shenzhenensis]|uniref:Beta-galactosidase n=1 Tax=Schleiferilactobacillus shenzhenensis LY-73 TaxID=1231336 RepID=U4TS26_9LACO|nr:beta-galactosidase family protein [Schleiferilactobacillus shenzhenensis]ERL64703.1 Bga [Schleiferilactobacillus shenzhenensis LY-73]
MKFDIRDQFYIDDQPVKLISGALHYFRTTPGKWRQALHNLRAMGGNTVETYIPWNLHEPEQGQFNFSWIADLPAFIQMAADEGLYVILRPGPYICAEWEYGGYPYWLLNTTKRVRSQDPQYMQAVTDYFNVLLPKIAPYQYTQGGPVLMLQVENEYGSYGNDKRYLQDHIDLIRRNGIDIPLFTADGAWQPMIADGNAIDQGVTETLTFGSDAAGSFAELDDYMADHHPGWEYPLMCMEFWDSWFNNWGKPPVRRSAEETASEVGQVLDRGSINLYMFHGGTNFGFMNGANYSEKDGYHPQVTAYDYDGPLTEDANPNKKFAALREVIEEKGLAGELPAPIVTQPAAYPTVPLRDKVSLFNTLPTLAPDPVVSDQPLTMEELHQAYGYVLYESVAPIRQAEESRLTIQDSTDRLQLFLNHTWQATRGFSLQAFSTKITVPTADMHVQVLSENQGRINYGPEMISPLQRRGIRGGIRQDSAYIAHWRHYSLPLQTPAGVDFNQDWAPHQPAFYWFTLTLDKAPQDTFIDIAKMGKGVIFVNGFNIGRFWEIGPDLTMYVPYDLLKQGQNEIIVFETEGRPISELRFSSRAVKMEGK